jgi:hypothetical protein
MLIQNLGRITMKYNFKRPAAVILAFGPSSHAFSPFPLTQQNQSNLLSKSPLIFGTQQRLVSSSSKRIDRELSKLNLSSNNSENDEPEARPAPSPSSQAFRKGNPILVEVVRFGPLGASVAVIGRSHDQDEMIPEDEPPLAQGLILQSEIKYFRAGRGGVDVVIGEVLPAYVDWVRDDAKVDISLRKPGGKGKTEDLGVIILDKLKEVGEIDVGDKSDPLEINKVFPGSSKAAFKRAVSALYKKGLVQPGPNSTKLM